jgi:hypothetical protein
LRSLHGASIGISIRSLEKILLTPLLAHGFELAHQAGLLAGD